MPHIRATPYYITYKDIFLSRLKSILNLDKKERKDFFIYHFLTSNKPWNSNRPDNMLFYKYLYSKYVVNPPKKFVSEIIKENHRKHPLWWKLFMKYFS